MTSLGVGSAVEGLDSGTEFGPDVSPAYFSHNAKLAQAYIAKAPKEAFNEVAGTPKWHQWGVARVRSRCEKALADVLSVLKIPWYLPLTPRKSADRHTFHLPLFPGFLFFQLKRGRIKQEVALKNNPAIRLKPQVTAATGEAYYELDAREVMRPTARLLKESPITARSASYVVGFIPVVDQIQFLKELAALANQDKKDRENSTLFNSRSDPDYLRSISGKRVEILDGPFKDFVGKLCLPKMGHALPRVLVELEIMQRPICIEVKDHWLKVHGN